MPLDGIDEESVSEPDRYADERGALWVYTMLLTHVIVAIGMRAEFRGQVTLGGGIVLIGLALLVALGAVLVKHCRY